MFAGRLTGPEHAQSLIPMKRLLVQVTLGFVEESNQFDCTCFCCMQVHTHNLKTKGSSEAFFISTF